MELYEVIKKRKSIRKYKTANVESDKLKRILNVARLAPSAKNIQPWKIIVVSDSKLKDKIANASYKQEHLAQAPYVISGGLVRWLKPEEFGTISKTRNPIIASLLSKTIFVEKMRTGINRIRKAMKSSNLPAPEFKFYEHSFYTTLIDKTMIKGAVSESQKTVEKTGRKTRNLSRKELLTLLENKVGSRLVEKVGSKLVEKVGSRLVENQLRIILLISEDEKIESIRRI